MNSSTSKTIFLVDDNISNLKVGRQIMKDKYTTFAVPSADAMFELLESTSPDMILLDIEMPGMNGFETISRLKSDIRYRDIPVIFLTAKNSEKDEQKGLSLGAIDYISKPFSPTLLLLRIENHMLMIEQNKELHALNENLEEKVREETFKVLELQEAILSTLADIVEFRDNDTGGHIARTKRYMEVLLAEVQQDKVYGKEARSWNVDNILQSSQLHDVGKIAIGDLILNKPGKLTEEEFEIMKTHASAGVQVINQIGAKIDESDFLNQARKIAGAHHEKWDGSGYPLGLKGEEIPLVGRMMAIADVFDALVSVRPYKPAMSPEEARKIIVESSGTHFDPRLVDVFEKSFQAFAEISRES